MRRRVWFVLVLGPLVAANPGEPSEDLEHNRALLNEYLASPETYQRLRRDLRAFYALPRERQEKLRRLDKAMHEGGPREQERRWAVVARYVAWLERLPEPDRQRVLGAGGPDARLAIVREIRDRQWIDSLPEKSKLRAGLRKLSPAERAPFVALERRKERERRAHLQSAPMPPAFPTRLRDLPPEVVAFVRKTLRPMLSEEESKKLDGTEGKGWPQYLRVVRTLADRHPVLPPVHGKKGATRLEELPAAYKRAFTPPKAIKPNRAEQFQKMLAQLKKHEGRWPDYARKAAELGENLAAKRKGVVLPPLGACRPDQFAPEMQRFLLERLRPPFLTGDEFKELKAREGHWPRYPLYLHKLARDKALIVPGLTLPGPADLWVGVRPLPP